MSEEKKGSTCVLGDILAKLRSDDVQCDPDDKLSEVERFLLLERVWHFMEKDTAYFDHVYRPAPAAQGGEWVSVEDRLPKPDAHMENKFLIKYNNYGDWDYEIADLFCDETGEFMDKANSTSIYYAEYWKLLPKEMQPLPTSPPEGE